MTDWSIQSRAHQCTTTGRSFVEDEIFYTLLFDEKTGYRREDLCQEAYQARPADAAVPFSFWRTKYTPPPPPAPEAIGKQTAEDLLRRYMEQPMPTDETEARKMAAARYLLAVMLERKRILKEAQVKRVEDGTLVRIYERAVTGEVFIIPDPELKLDEIESVQALVAELLG